MKYDGFSYGGDIMKFFKWFVLVFLFFGFSFLAYLVINDKISFFDNFVYDVITFYQNDFWTGFFKFITFFASVLMIALVSLFSFLIFKNKRYGVFISLNAIFLLILNILLKFIFMRERPFELMIIIEDGYSFPSGHAMAALGFYGFIIYLLCHLNVSKKVKYVWTLFLGLFIILIGISRIYLGVHYASDVLGGFLVSGFYLILFTTFCAKFLKES